MPIGCVMQLSSLTYAQFWRTVIRARHPVARLQFREEILVRNGGVGCATEGYQLKQNHSKWPTVHSNQAINDQWSGIGSTIMEKNNRVFEYLTKKLGPSTSCFSIGYSVCVWEIGYGPKKTKFWDERHLDRWVYEGFTDVKQNSHKPWKYHAIPLSAGILENIMQNFEIFRRAVLDGRPKSSFFRKQILEEIMCLFFGFSKRPKPRSTILVRIENRTKMFPMPCARNSTKKGPDRPQMTQWCTTCLQLIIDTYMSLAAVNVRSKMLSIAIHFKGNFPAFWTT